MHRANDPLYQISRPQKQLKHAFVERFNIKALEIDIRDKKNVKINLSKEGNIRRQGIYDDILKDSERKGFSQN